MKKKKDFENSEFLKLLYNEFEKRYNSYINEYELNENDFLDFEGDLDKECLQGIHWRKFLGEKLNIPFRIDENYETKSMQWQTLMTEFFKDENRIRKIRNTKKKFKELKQNRAVSNSFKARLQQTIVYLYQEEKRGMYIGNWSEVSKNIFNFYNPKKEDIELSLSTIRTCVNKKNISAICDKEIYQEIEKFFPNIRQ
ncbi:MAG: hypothetical protein WCT77_13295 [Bacteroidota bacterium]